LFGSFQPEEEEPTYGLTKPLRSWNPLWANVHHYVDLAREGASAPTLSDRVELWLRGPGWKPEWLARARGHDPRPTPLSHGAAGKYDRRPPATLVAYGVAQFLVAIGATLVLLWTTERSSWSERAILAAAVAWTVLDVGVLFDCRLWVVRSELLRLAALWTVAAFAASRSLTGAAFAWFAVGALALTAAFAAWLLRARGALAGTSAGAQPLVPAAAESVDG
jgi:hypothetical protein